MPVDTPTPEPTPEPTPVAPTEPTEKMIPKTRFDEVNSKYKETESRLAELEAALAERQKADAEAELKSKQEQGKFEELYQTTEKELNGYKEKATTYESRTSELEAVINSLVEAEVNAIGEDYAELIPAGLTPEAKLAWINKAKEKGLFVKQEREIGTPKSGGQPTTPKTDVAKMNPLDKIRMGLGK